MGLISIFFKYLNCVLQFGLTLGLHLNYALLIITKNACLYSGCLDGMKLLTIDYFLLEIV